MIQVALLATRIGAAGIDRRHRLQRPAGDAARNPRSCSGTDIERVVAFADVHGAYTELHHAAARDRGRRRAGPLVGRAHACREPGRPAGSRRRFAQGDGPADAPAGRGTGGGRATARAAGQPRGHESARRPALCRAGEFAAYADLESSAERAQLRAAWEAAHGAGSGQTSTTGFRPGTSGSAALFRPRVNTASGC